MVRSCEIDRKIESLLTRGWTSALGSSSLSSSGCSAKNGGFIKSHGPKKCQHCLGGIRLDNQTFRTTANPKPSATSFLDYQSDFSNIFCQNLLPKTQFKRHLLEAQPTCLIDHGLATELSAKAGDDDGVLSKAPSKGCGTRGNGWSWDPSILDFMICFYTWERNMYSTNTKNKMCTKKKNIPKNDGL